MYFGNWMLIYLLEKVDDIDECMLKYVWNGFIGFFFWEIIFFLLNLEYKYVYLFLMFEKLKLILISNFFERVFFGFILVLMSEKLFFFI